MVKPPEPSSSRSKILNRLRTLVSRNPTPNSFHNDEPRHRGIVISVCLLCSVLLWLIFSLREIQSIPLELPTQIRNLPVDQALTSLPPRSVRVQIQGEGIQLIRLYYDTPTITIDASQQQISLDAVTADLIKNARVENVIPHLFLVQKEERVSKRVPIVPRISIKTRESFDLVEPIRLTPDSLVISGARSVVGGITSWLTEKTSFRDVRDTLYAQIPLVDTLEGLVFKNIDAVTVRAISEEFTEGEREIKVLVPGAPLGEEYMSLSPPIITVRYLVPISQFDAAHQAEDFFATVSYDVIRADTTGRVSPQLHLPANLALREVTMTPQTLGYYNVLVDER